jgi:hypothetical protein
MKFKFNALVILVAVISLVVWSCGRKGDKEKNSNDFKDAGRKTLSDEITDLTGKIPPATEIPYLLEQTGAEFNQNLVNDRRKVDTYTEQDKAALNLGVYSADIAYVASYEKTQQTIDYLNTCKSMAEKLGITGSFDAELIKKIEDNIGNKDELAKLINETLKKADQYLQEGKRSELSALLVTGAFVEGLYMSTGIVKSYPKNLLPEDKKNLVLTPLMKVIINQKESVSEVAKMLSAVNQTGSVPAILNDMKALETSYKALDIADKIAGNKGALALSDKNLEEITRLVEKLRGDIVQ